MILAVSSGAIGSTGRCPVDQRAARDADARLAHPVRLHRTRRARATTPSGAIYVGRPTIYGNPFARRLRSRMTRPRLAWPEHHAYLAAATVHLLRQREAGYPALVTKGAMTEAAAGAKLELSRVLVAQWIWATDPAQPPLPPLAADRPGHFGAWSRELADELAETAATARARAADRPLDRDRAMLADLCDALAWYQVGTGADCRLTDDILFYRAVNAALRAQLADQGEHRRAA